LFDRGHKIWSTCADSPGLPGSPSSDPEKRRRLLLDEEEQSVLRLDQLQRKCFGPRGPKRVAREIRESKLRISALLAQLRGTTIDTPAPAAGL